MPPEAGALTNRVSGGPASGDPQRDKKELEGQRTSRRKITGGEFVLLAKGAQLPENLIYVGRGGRGAPPSKWGNPFRAKGAGGRQEAVAKYRHYLLHGRLAGDLHELRGKTLLCHCRPDQACHAEVLAELAEESGGAPQRHEEIGIFVDDGLPNHIPEPSVQKEPLEERPAPRVASGWRGKGAPRSTRGFGGNGRLPTEEAFVPQGGGDRAAGDCLAASPGKSRRPYLKSFRLLSRASSGGSWATWTSS